MVDYQYALIRYVPNRERMEPINVGIILQGQGHSNFRFSPHAAKRKDVDTPAFRQWKEFFQQEFADEDNILFRPPKSSPEFLHFLENLCDGPILLSRPLAISTPQDRSFEDVLSGLFERLVLPPELQSSTEASRPTGRFRRLSDERKFLQRGLRQYVHVPVENVPHRWTAYRQVLNGQFIAVDKIEVARELGRTATEIDKLALVTGMLDQYMRAKIEGKATRYVLLADELKEPFTDQSQEEFEAMRTDLEETADKVHELGGEVLRTPERAEQFAAELDKKLPQAA